VKSREFKPREYYASELTFIYPSELHLDVLKSSTRAIYFLWCLHAAVENDCSWRDSRREWKRVSDHWCTFINITSVARLNTHNIQTHIKKLIVYDPCVLLSLSRVWEKRLCAGLSACDTAAERGIPRGAALENYEYMLPSACSPLGWTSSTLFFSADLLDIYESWMHVIHIFPASCFTNHGQAGFWNSRVEKKQEKIMSS
jgi:hypothetical protein